MPVRCQIQDGVVTVAMGDTFSTEDLAQALADATRLPEFSAPMPIVFDNRVSQESASQATIRERAQRFAAARAYFGPRIAVVVSDDLHHGLARMAGAYVSPADMELRVFSDLDEAVAWVRPA